MTGFFDGAFVGFFLGGDVTGFFVQPLLPSPLHAGFFVVGDVVCTDIIFRTRFTFFQST
jgi:hypothetical protein